MHLTAMVFLAGLVVGVSLAFGLMAGLYFMGEQLKG